MPVHVTTTIWGCDCTTGTKLAASNWPAVGDVSVLVQQYRLEMSLHVRWCYVDPVWPDASSSGQGASHTDELDAACGRSPISE
jgi:hypothetical protein